VHDRGKNPVHESDEKGAIIRNLELAELKRYLPIESAGLGEAQKVRRRRVDQVQRSQFCVAHARNWKSRYHRTRFKKSGMCNLGIFAQMIKLGEKGARRMWNHRCQCNVVGIYAINEVSVPGALAGNR
jgi:hypothetical protein